MTTPEVPMFCRTCRRALDVAVSGGVRRWMHGGGDPSKARRLDHVPLPVKVTALADPIIQCDFCGEDGAVYNFVCAEMDTRVAMTSTTVGTREYRDRNRAAKGRVKSTGDIGGLGSGGDWAACLACTGLVDARDLDALVTRVAEHAPQRFRRRLAVFRADLVARYTVLFETLQPGRRRILPEPGVLLGPLEYPTTGSSGSATLPASGGDRLEEG